MKSKILFACVNLPICLVLVGGLFACKKQPESKNDFSDYAGQWKNYRSEERVEFNLTKDGDVELVGSGYYDVAFAYKGKIVSKNGQYEYDLDPLSGWGQGSKETGTLTLNREGNKVRLVFAQKPAEVFSKEFVFFKEGEPFDVDFKGQMPTVLDFFKAVYPHVFNPVIDWAYNSIVNGKSSSSIPDDKTVDFQNGYISFVPGDCGPCSTMECCFWITADKSRCLFAIATHGESPDIQPTTFLQFYEYDVAKGTMQEIDPPFDLKKSNKEEDWHIVLPKNGTDIKVQFITDDYDEKSSMLLKWNGKGFDVKK